jgi:hypothetical protein
VPGSDFTIGGRRFGLFARDFRRIPRDAWLRLMFERDLIGEDAAAPVSPSLPVVVLSQPTLRRRYGRRCATYGAATGWRPTRCCAPVSYWRTVTARHRYRRCGRSSRKRPNGSGPTHAMRTCSVSSTARSYTRRQVRIKRRGTRPAAEHLQAPPQERSRAHRRGPVDQELGRD